VVAGGPHHGSGSDHCDRHDAPALPNDHTPGATAGGLSENLLDANLQMLGVLGSAIAKRDSDTDVHNYRVTIYSVRLAEAVGLDEATIRSLMKERSCTMWERSHHRRDPT